MKHSLKMTQIAASLLAVAATSTGCSDDSPQPSGPLRGAGAAWGAAGTMAGTGGASAPTPPDAGGGAGGNSEVLPDPTLASRDLPVGWASVWAGDDAKTTTGGADADADHIFTVTNRTELVRALYPDAVIADDGTFTTEAGADPTPKIIYVRGTISLSSNAAGEELTLEDYACEGYDFEAYKAAYDPKEWNKLTPVDGDPPEILPCPGSQEELRQCSSNRQALVVQLRVGSNTTLLGVGNDAKIVHGMLLIGAGSAPPGRRLPPPPPSDTPAPIDPELAEACGIVLPPEPDAGPAPEPDPTPAPAPAPAASPPFVENVVVRNITFEDAYDLFASWDPADSYTNGPEVADPTDLLYPKCQATYDEVTDNGPHQCRGGRWNSRYDNVQVQNASHVWIDHCTFNDGDRETQSIPSVWEFPYDDHVNAVQPHDGLLDIVNASDFVTVSYNSFRNHDKTTLIGGSDTVTERNGWGVLSVTVHHNQYINVGQRTPRVRFGKVHVYSNFVQGALNPEIEVPEDRNKPRPPYPMGSALAAGHLAKLYSENNAFEITGYPGDPAPTARDVISTAHRATPTEGDGLDVNQSTYFFDSGSILNGAPADLEMAAQESAADGDRPVLLPTDTIWTPASTYDYEATPAADVKALLEANAGAGVLEIAAP